MSEATAERKNMSNFAGILILVKLAPKLLPLLAKLGKAFTALLKGLLGFKGVGAVSSLGLYSLLFSWQMAVSLVFFILIHEYGHLLAMKRCGIKTRGIYLIPGFGGAAIADERWKSAENEAYIAIMGPIFSLVFILPMMGLYFITQNPMYAAIASITSLVNLFNLFPINPLDGGRIVKALLYSFHGSMGFFFSLVSLFLAMVFGFYTGLTLLLIIAVIGLQEVTVDYGLKESLDKIIKTIYRLIGVFFLLELWPAWFFESSALSYVLCCVFGIILAFFASDMYYSKTVLFYPWIVVKDIFLGSRELLSIQPRNLKTIKDYSPMNGQLVSWYSVAYIVIIVVMVGLIIYTSTIEGCQIAKEMLT